MTDEPEPATDERGLARRDVLKLAGSASAAGTVAAVGGAAAAPTQKRGDVPANQPDRGDPAAYEDYTVRRVPEQYDTIQAAVNDAEERDLVLVGPGVYNEAVTIQDTNGLTIRGTDRNEVVLDGEFQRRNGITAIGTNGSLEDIVLENMTARNYQYNGFYWTGVDGWRGSYLTAHNNRMYGIYAFDSVNGKFEQSYASGHRDSGFYIGQCYPCHAIIDDIVSEGNAVGYSGTNAGGYLTLKNSVWRENMSGILPNSLDSEELAPQGTARIENNVVERNNNVGAPARKLAYPAFGTGINIAGGVDNEVVGNEVRDHVNFGLIASINISENLYKPADNVFRENTVERSGRADLAVGAPSGGGNRFEANEYDSSRPAGLQDGFGLLGSDIWPTLVLGKQFLQGFGEPPRGDWKEYPHPDDQPTMPDPESPPREAVAEKAEVQYGLTPGRGPGAVTGGER
ncbi:right-handed parallel beta-helix repeat-containing protein [Haloglomus salinum]|uniref:right-handed parallel beta-helix repeat-containing protein n=1 Tax=Haloglomus salinum TaxID=2962673 RepID=UPI0020C949D4|nr:right-handed parallel beta-helix repeat-containing protein [Haloglomus salinum]